MGWICGMGVCEAVVIPPKAFVGLLEKRLAFFRSNVLSPAVHFYLRIVSGFYYYYCLY